MSGKTIYQLLAVTALAATLAACGGSTSGGDDDNGGGSSGGGSGGGGDGVTNPIDAGVNLLASSNNLPSNAATVDQGIEITAIVRNSQNNVVEGQNVSFSANSGAIQVTQSTTGEAGEATAVLTTGGDPTNRTITITANTGSSSDTVRVDVVGTQLSVSGPSALALNDQATFTASLTDAGGSGIANQAIEVRSANGNSLGMMSGQTLSNGNAPFTVTARNAGTDTLTVRALGLSTTATVDVAGANFQFTQPADETQVALNASQTVNLRWLDNGTPVTGQTVDFSTTRGTLNRTRGTTDSEGRASVSVSSNDAGPATITATTGSGLQTTTTIRFIATVPDSLDVQADPATVAPNTQSSITAIVRDADNNLVTGQTVNFTLNDTSGGSLSTGSAVTNTNGRASTIYTSGSTSASQPATITATVASNTSISNSTSVTVGGQALRITLGTGNELEEPTSTVYRLPYVALVTDANGAPVSNANFRLTVESLAYRKGSLAFSDEANAWVFSDDSPTTCENEDTNRNGILDPGEDENRNGTLQPGNVASVPSSAQLNADGIAEFDVTYPQNFAQWVQIRLRAIAEVQGTETTAVAEFVLPVLASDVNTANQSPPNLVSPFGTANDCTNPN